MRAIEYISYADAVGYGIAAVGYVRLLVEAGFQVHWTLYPYSAVELRRVGQPFGAAELSRGRASLIARGLASADSRLKPLVEATSLRSTPASASSTSCQATGPGI